MALNFSGFQKRLYTWQWRRRVEADGVSLHQGLLGHPARVGHLDPVSRLTLKSTPALAWPESYRTLERIFWCRGPAVALPSDSAACFIRASRFAPVHDDPRLGSLVRDGPINGTVLPNGPELAVRSAAQPCVLVAGELPLGPQITDEASPSLAGWPREYTRGHRC